jgi:hypothetical protein
MEKKEKYRKGGGGQEGRDRGRSRRQRGMKKEEGEKKTNELGVGWFFWCPKENWGLYSLMNRPICPWYFTVVF